MPLPLLPELRALGSGFATYFGLLWTKMVGGVTSKSDIKHVCGDEVLVEETQVITFGKVDADSTLDFLASLLCTRVLRYSTVYKNVINNTIIDKTTFLNFKQWYLLSLWIL